MEIVNKVDYKQLQWEAIKRPKVCDSVLFTAAMLENQDNNPIGKKYLPSPFSFNSFLS